MKIWYLPAALIGAAIGFALAFNIAKADECTSFQTVKMAAEAEGTSHIEMGTEKDRLTALFNAVEPVSDIHSERLIVAASPRLPFVFFVFVDGDCIKSVNRVAVPLFKQWLAAEKTI